MKDKDKLMIILHDAEARRDHLSHMVTEILETEEADRIKGNNVAVPFDYGMKIGYQYAETVLGDLVTDIIKIISEET